MLILISYLFTKYTTQTQKILFRPWLAEAINENKNEFQQLK